MLSEAPFSRQEPCIPAPKSLILPKRSTLPCNTPSMAVCVLHINNLILSAPVFIHHNKQCPCRCLADRRALSSQTPRNDTHIAKYRKEDDFGRAVPTATSIATPHPSHGRINHNERSNHYEGTSDMQNETPINGQINRYMFIRLSLGELRTYWSTFCELSKKLIPHQCLGKWRRRQDHGFFGVVCSNPTIHRNKLLQTFPMSNLKNTLPDIPRK